MAITLEPLPLETLANAQAVAGILAPAFAAGSITQSKVAGLSDALAAAGSNSKFRLPLITQLTGGTAGTNLSDVVKANYANLDTIYLPHWATGGPKTFQLVSGAWVESYQIPDVFLSDYITVQNFAGLEIPANSFGRKGAVPYFGNTPIQSQNVKFYNGIGGTSPKALASFAIPPELYVAGQFFWLEIDLIVVNTGTPAAYATILSLDAITGRADDGSTGTYIDVGSATAVRVGYSGLVKLTSTGSPKFDSIVLADGALRITHQTARAAPGAILNSIYLPSAGVYISDYPFGGGAYGSAETITLRLLNLVGGVTSTAVSGTASFTPYTP